MNQKEFYDFLSAETGKFYYGLRDDYDKPCAPIEMPIENWQELFEKFMSIKIALLHAVCTGNKRGD